MSANRFVVVSQGGDATQQRLVTDINAVLTRIGIALDPPRLAVADLPTDDSIRLAIVTDEAGGEVLAFLDSLGDWRRTTDRAICS